MPKDFNAIESEAKKQAEQAERQDENRYANIAPGSSLGRINLDNSHQELRDAAATLSRLGAYFSQLENVAPAEGRGDELDAELRDYMKDGFGFDEYKSNLYETAQLINQLTPVIEKYVSYNDKVNGDYKERLIALEADDYRKMKDLLDKCMTNLNKCLNYKESESVMFRNLYSQVANTTIMLEDMTNGHLVLPVNDGPKDLDGTAFRRMKCLDKDVDLMSQAITETSEDVKKKVGVRMYIGRRFVSVGDMPLFTHEPNEEDLNQNGLGNCYMLATLAAIAKNDPARIKDAIRDNGDETVTVRFFDNNNRPVYVTVQKTVPYIEGIGDAPFSRGALWVKMVEKAYAASGLKERTRGPGERAKQSNSYYEIEAGEESLFMQAFLGPEAKTVAKPVAHQVVYSNTVGPNYSAQELETFNFIKDAVDHNRVIAAGTRTGEEFAEIAKRVPDTYPNATRVTRETTNIRRYAGVNRKHAYTISNVKEINGLKYVVLRNPHTSDGMIIEQDGSVKAKKDAQGEIYVELRNFRMLYRDISVAKFDLPPLERVRGEQARSFRSEYGSWIRQIAEELKATENMFNWEFWDSPQFRLMDACAKTLVAAVYAEPAAMAPIEQAFREFVDSAQAYRAYRELATLTATNPVKQAEKDARPRSVARLNAANKILALAQQYDTDQVAKTARAAEQRPTLDAQLAEAPAAEAPQHQWLTLEDINERVEQRKAMISEEDVANFTYPTYQKASYALKNMRFKELRHIICEGDLEENASINASLLQARAFLLAGHTADELKHTEIGADKGIAPYIDLLAQVVAEDQAQRENDLAFENRLFGEEFGAIEEPQANDLQPEAGDEPQPEVLSPKEQAAKAVIEGVLRTQGYEAVCKEQLKMWNAAIESNRLPLYHKTMADDKLNYSVHVKNADRDARRELSRKGVELYSKMLSEKGIALNVAKAMVDASDFDEKKKADIKAYVDGQNDLMYAMLEVGNDPKTAMDNLELADILTNGTPERKTELISARMAQLTALQAGLAIEKNTSDPVAMQERLDRTYRVMNAVVAMRNYLTSDERKKTGITSAQVKQFLDQTKDNFEAYQANFEKLAEVSNPTYIYYDKDEGRKCLDEYTDNLAASIKSYSDQIAEKQALPQTKKVKKEIETLKANRESLVGNIMGALCVYSDLKNADIAKSALAESKLSDFNVRVEIMRMLNNKTYKLMVKELDPDKLVKTVNGKTTLNLKEALGFYNNMIVYNNMTKLNKQIEKDARRQMKPRQPAARNADAQPNVPQN